MPRYNRRRDFNPRSRKGFEVFNILDNLCGYDFNPRSRKGFDTNDRAFSKWFQKFQSTKPQGLRRNSAKESSLVHMISIHEAARASTCSVYQQKISFCISIHEAARASTIKPLHKKHSYVDFNPRSRKGFDSKYN